MTRRDKVRAAHTYSVPPVVRAVKLLRFIAAGGSVVNQSEASRVLGISRTTLLRLLHTLEAEGLIERIPGSGEHVLGTGIIELAARKLSSLDVTQVAGPVLSALAGELGLACHLGILDRREVVYVMRCAPNAHLVSYVRVGSRLPAHASSMGRAILAHIPREQVDAIFRGGQLKSVSGSSPTTLAALHAVLASIRASGIVDSRSGYEQGIDSIAAPVYDHSGAVIAAINASGPEGAFATPRFRRARIAQRVGEAAQEISWRMGFVGEGKQAAARRVGRTHR